MSQNVLPPLVNKSRCTNCIYCNCNNANDCDECPLYEQCEPFNGDYENWHLCPCVECNFDFSGECKFFTPIVEDDNAM